MAPGKTGEKEQGDTGAVLQVGREGQGGLGPRCCLTRPSLPIAILGLRYSSKTNKQKKR